LLIDPPLRDFSKVEQKVVQKIESISGDNSLVASISGDNSLVVMYIKYLVLSYDGLYQYCTVLYIYIYYTLRFYFSYLSLLAQPITPCDIVITNKLTGTEYSLVILSLPTNWLVLNILGMCDVKHNVKIYTEGHMAVYGPVRNQQNIISGMRFIKYLDHSK
jgi:hypothetical protein